MFAARVYKLFLRLYPAAFRARFAAEMVAVFDQSAAQHRALRFPRFVLFIVNELLGLIAGAAQLRVLRTDGDRSPDIEFPSDIATAEKYLEMVSRRLIHAIANHDFPNARHYDLQDRKARAFLAQLRSQ